MGASAGALYQCASTTASHLLEFWRVVASRAHAALVARALLAVLHHFGVPLTVGLAGTLLWRGFSLFLPALGGVLAYLSLRYEHPASGGGVSEPVVRG